MTEHICPKIYHKRKSANNNKIRIKISKFFINNRNYLNKSERDEDCFRGFMDLGNKSL